MNALHCINGGVQGVIELWERVLSLRCSTRWYVDRSKIRGTINGLKTKNHRLRRGRKFSPLLPDKKKKKKTLFFFFELAESYILDSTAAQNHVRFASVGVTSRRWMRTAFYSVNYIVISVYRIKETHFCGRKMIDYVQELMRLVLGAARKSVLFNLPNEFTPRRPGTNKQCLIKWKKILKAGRSGGGA